MILMIDNYDSFTYNLVQYLSELGERVVVYRNDQISVQGIKRLNPKRIVISPGPGTPLDAGISNQLIEELSGRIPILGVCLGHQCIGHVFGGKIVRAKRIMHGKVSEIYHNGRTIFKGLPVPFTATRYHSLLIENKSFPEVLEITARTKAKEIMGIRHRKHPTFGVQFHPESIMTPVGKKLLRNFIRL
ncbi:MAG: anthranilate/aminodeoxychorismate synthase component II [Omnitrophica bacterium RIFCSPLOWO2_01_FULL_50_24]|nr:MAG: anthranilate/aminodeoxychorismate synthase component II [Omnitrophica bacterium RIFCSPLOWO2_01_FULL_50_24]